MKKILLVLVSVFLVGQALSAVDFYGNARIGYWYDMQDKDFTGSEARTVLNYDLFSTSRFGVIFKGEAYTGKVEFSLSGGGAKLRQIWGEYDFGFMKMLIGQYYTGFFDLPNQATSIISASENLMIGYGLMYDSRNPMIKLSLENGMYIIFMEPKLIDPAEQADSLGVEIADIVDALFPKINFGCRMSMGNLMIHPTFGINMSQYNKDFADGIDESILAYVTAVSTKYSAENFSFLAQVSYGQNVADYGMLSSATGGSATWDGTDILDATTMGGYLEFTYKLCPKKALTAGGGYFSTDRDDYDDPDTAWTGYLQAKINLHNHMFIVPEIGMINEAEDGMGNTQGAHTYFGLNFQADFDLSIK